MLGKSKIWFLMLLSTAALMTVAVYHIYQNPSKPYILAQKNDEPSTPMTSSQRRPLTTCTHAHTGVSSLKVHKAGSTSVMNILQRYAWQNDLLVAMPTTYNIIQVHFGNLVPLPKNRTYYDMLFNHVYQYNHERFAELVPPDAKHIGIVREPLSLTISAFEYYRTVYPVGIYTNVPGPDKLAEYLKNREKYDKKPPGSFTNNRMAFDFGLPTDMFRNESYIKSYLQKLESEFDLVMVLEYFAESLVLFRRLMCWDMKDVLFVKRNAHEKHSNKVTFTKEELVYHKNFSMADNIFYDHFLTLFKEKLQEQPPDFMEEVSVFKEALGKVTEYCLSFKGKNLDTTKDSYLWFPKTKFSEAFEVSPQTCKLMLLEELTFCSMTRAKQDLLKEI